MKEKTNTLPIAVSAVIALVITVVVRLMFGPSNVASPDKKTSMKELSMPDIPLMAKEVRKAKDVQVLMVAKDIKKDKKIQMDDLSWKKWPEAALQSYFIAKDEQGVALNNGADYGNAMKMWAANDIPAGIPLTIRMLTNDDPVKKAEEERKKKEEALKKEQEAKLKKEQERKAEFVKKGMRAITFPIDQKTASSSSMMEPGNIVDVLIMEQRGDRVKSHKYVAIKILAIDGITKFEKKPGNGEKKDGGLLGNIYLGSAVGGLLLPKNVTLEIREELVDVMLKQLGNGGVTLSIRNQEEIISEEEAGKEIDESEDMLTRDTVLQHIMEMNKQSAAQAIVSAKEAKEAEERGLDMLIRNINSLNDKGFVEVATEAPTDASGEKALEAQTLVKKAKRPPNTGKLEFVSGKAVGEEEPEKRLVRLYRKLTPNEVEFDSNGEKLGSGGDGSESAAGIGGGVSGSSSPHSAKVRKK
ncbi:MAG: SAF domain-containing protein [Holosporaceae bacterium]|jgi:Flp pilus assembly protein CpaB|nr:SAF domain-containing protein [Holosporaceae bacterium]